MPAHYQNVLDRLKRGEKVYGFELALVADHISQSGEGLGG